MMKGDRHHHPRPLGRGSEPPSFAHLLFGMVALFALSASTALAFDSSGSPDGQGEAGSETIVLDLYLDDCGRALIVGYLKTDRLEDLAFLDGSELEYDEDTGELYALSDGLTSRRGEETRLDFEAEGLWDECHLAFYLPKDAALLNVSSSEGLAYSVSEAEGSMVVEALGYEVEGAEVIIDYQILG